MYNVNLWLYEATRNVFWTPVQFRPGPPKKLWSAPCDNEDD